MEVSVDLDAGRHVAGIAGHTGEHLVGTCASDWANLRDDTGKTSFTLLILRQ
jgi:hypothetical protein